MQGAGTAGRDSLLPALRIVGFASEAGVRPIQGRRQRMSYEERPWTIARSAVSVLRS